MCWPVDSTCENEHTKLFSVDTISPISYSLHTKAASLTDSPFKYVNISSSIFSGRFDRRRHLDSSRNLIWRKRKFFCLSIAFFILCGREMRIKLIYQFAFLNNLRLQNTFGQKIYFCKNIFSASFGGQFEKAVHQPTRRFCLGPSPLASNSISRLQALQLLCFRSKIEQ